MIKKILTGHAAHIILSTVAKFGGVAVNRVLMLLDAGLALIK